MDEISQLLLKYTPVPALLVDVMYDFLQPKVIVLLPEIRDYACCDYFAKTIGVVDARLWSWIREVERNFPLYEITVHSSEIERHGNCRRQDNMLRHIATSTIVDLNASKRTLAAINLIADQHYFQCIIDSVACFALDLLSQGDLKNKFHKSHWHYFENQTGAYYTYSRCEKSLDNHVKQLLARGLTHIHRNFSTIYKDCTLSYPFSSFYWCRLVFSNASSKWCSLCNESEQEE